MNPKQELIRKIAVVRRQWKNFLWIRGLAWVLGVGVASLFVGMGVANSTTMPAWSVVLIRWALVGAILAVIVRTLVIPLRCPPRDAQLARFVEEKHPGLSDRFVSAVELAQKPKADRGALRYLLFKDAMEKTRPVRFGELINRRRQTAAWALTAVFGIAWVAALYLSSSLFPYGSARLFAGLLGSPAPALFRIEVSPGEATVPRGSDVVVEAKTLGFDAERAEVHLLYENSAQWETALMEFGPKTVPTFERLLFNVQEPFRYFVQAGGHRSDEFRINVGDLPRVVQMDYTYHFPAYTGLASEKEENALDIVALRGTAVEVAVLASETIQAGRLVFEDDRTVDLTASGPKQAAGRLTIDRTSTFRVELTDTRGQSRLGLEEYAMEALDDQRPIVEFTRPGRDYKATTVEEVFTELRAEDDFGLKKLDLHYSVNGSEVQRVALFENQGRAPKDISGGYTFFLEEHELEPGDFVTYYGEAVDSRRPSNSVMTDIYFIEIRPFGREYYQAQAGAAGGRQGDDSAEALSRRQKEIIAATFRLIRDRKNFEPEEYSDNIQAVATNQNKLAEQTETLMTRLRRRGLVMQPRICQLVENMKQAVDQMALAAAELRKEALDVALPHEQRSLQFLMRAESLFNEVQVAMGNSARGGGMSSSAEDLADLFDLELDQDKNQYETLQRGEIERNPEEMKEALRKLKELADRQQKLMERQANPSGGDGGGSRMTAEQLQRETERLARRLDRLSRESNDRQMANVGRALQEAARNMQRQARSGNEGQQRLASVQALEQLRRAEQLLGMAGGSPEEKLAELGRQAEQLKNRQGQIARETEQLASQVGPDAPRRVEDLKQQKDGVARDLDNMNESLDALGRNQENRDLARKVRNASNLIRSGRLLDKINQGRQLLDNGYYGYAARREREIEESLGKLEQRLRDAAATASNSEQKRLQRALTETSETIRRLESMRRRLESGQPQSGEAASASSTNSGGVPLGTGDRGTRADRPPVDNARRQLAREWEERLRDVQEIRNQLGRNSPLAGDLDRVMAAMRLWVRDQFPGDAVELARLKAEIIDPFRSVELELSRALQVLMGAENIRSAREEEIPAGYKKLVEEYYKSLSDQTP